MLRNARPISGVDKRVVFQKGGFGGCSPGTKTGTRVHSDVPPERKPGTRYVRMFLWNENRNEGTFAKTTLYDGRFANGYFRNGCFEFSANRDSHFPEDWLVTCCCQRAPAFFLPFPSLAAAFQGLFMNFQSTRLQSTRLRASDMRPPFCLPVTITGILNVLPNPEPPQKKTEKCLLWTRPQIPFKMLQNP